MNVQGAGFDMLKNPDKLYDWTGLKQSPGKAETTQTTKAPFVQKPKKEKDPFLEGFYSVADKPKEERRSYTSPLAKSRAILDSMSQTKPAKRVVEEEEDDFLKGFYSVADRPKDEAPVTTKLQTDYKPGDWIRSTMTQPTLWYAKNTDLSPQKVNYASQTNTSATPYQNTRTGESRDKYDSRIRNQYAARRQAEEDATRERLQSIWDDMQANNKAGHWLRSAAENLPYAHTNINKPTSTQRTLNDISPFVNTVKRAFTPFKDTNFEYVDRNDIYTQFNSPVVATQNGWQKPREPLGNFGITSKGAPKLTDANGKPQANYILALDTKYIDENGVLRPSSVPQWNFNRDFIKQGNAQMIDQLAKSFASKLPPKQAEALLKKTDKVKLNNASVVDAVSAKTETLLNGVDEASWKTHINKKIAKVVDDHAILDSTSLKVGSKAVSAIDTVITIADFGISAYNDYKTDEVFGYETVKAAVGIAGEATGIALGAKAGAWIGAALGGIAGGVLAAPASMLGGFIGGYIGGKIGKYIGEKSIEENAEFFHR